MRMIRKADFRSLVESGIRDLYPGYFAFVMATGIVSIAAYLVGMTAVAWLLFRINMGAYALLCLLAAARLVRYFPRVLSDLRSHARAPGFLTVVAATSIVGSQSVILAGNRGVGVLFWLAGFVLWFLLMYAFLAAMAVYEPKPDLRGGLNGSWLIAVVATQSVSVCGAIALPTSQGVYLVSLAMYLLGCALYLILIPLILYRLLFFTLTPQEFTPPYWVDMGATAITSLAGATLLLTAIPGRLFLELRPFISGLTFLFWVVGTWWIPLLVILEVWRLVVLRFAVRYDPRYWDIVFPLGMYAASTFQWARAAGFHPLIPVARGFLYAALLTWIATCAGVLSRVGRSLAGEQQQSE